MIEKNIMIQIKNLKSVYSLHKCDNLFLKMINRINIFIKVS